MTYEELARTIYEALPGASMDEDDYGQIIVYTGMIQDEETGLIRDMTEEDFDKAVIY